MSAPDDTLPSGEWIPLFEDLLRGLVHAMNNRITAMSAFAELAAMDGDTVDIHMLRQEIGRLHGISALVGVLATKNMEPEGLEVTVVLDAALEIHVHRSHTRTVQCTVEQRGASIPVRVPRWALLRVLILMADAAKCAALEERATKTLIRIAGDEMVVRIHTTTSDQPGPDARMLATICGGSITSQNRQQTLELPSLLELRRRERLA